jgi:hypothetical protein
MAEQKEPEKEIDEQLKIFWRKKANPSIIAAKHSEFVVEPRIFIGDKLNPEILKLIVVSYLAHASKQDSGFGNIDVSPDKLIIKSPRGDPLVIVRDKKIIENYISGKK